VAPLAEPDAEAHLVPLPEAAYVHTPLTFFWTEIVVVEVQPGSTVATHVPLTVPPETVRLLLRLLARAGTADRTRTRTQITRQSTLDRDMGFHFSFIIRLFSDRQQEFLGLSVWGCLLANPYI
jgi:hypothetical protein